MPVCFGNKHSKCCSYIYRLCIARPPFNDSNICRADQGRDAASKVQRKVSKGISVPEYSRSGRRLQNRERMMILAKMVFSKQKTPSLLEKKELPSLLLEADQQDEGLPNLPEEVLYLLQSVKWGTLLLLGCVCLARGHDSNTDFQFWYVVCQVAAARHVRKSVVPFLCFREY